MKKMIVTALAALLLAVPVAQAQKFNKEAILAKITKSDADIADAKRNVKSATWLTRGKAFYEALSEPTKNVFVGMEVAMFKLALGEPTSSSKETIVGKEYDAMVYPYFTAYIADGKVVTWKQTHHLVKNAVGRAIDAYNKAFEIDPKSQDKVREGLKQISDFCSQVGNTGIDTGDYVAAADAYADAYKAQSSPAYESADAALLYYSGYLHTVNGSNDPKSFVKGSKYLGEALAKGYADADGNIYYYLFHSLYGQRESDSTNIVKAKDILLEGIAKFPKNERVLDGLMQLYTTEKGIGDPAELIILIDKAIENNPTSTDLLFGRGRIYYALKEYDKSIESFQKVAELKPELFESNYYVGIIYAFKGDEINKSLNDKAYSSQAAYDADLKVVNDIYIQAIPWLEKAHAIKPTDEGTIELLKQLCFRLREEAGIQAKYDQYNDIFKKMKGLE